MAKSYKKELIEWIFLILVIGSIYLGGWHTELIGRLQQAVVSIGILTPDRADSISFASYDFELEDTEGHNVNFANFKGEVIFLNFWATWCPPCVAEMPDINSLYKKTGDSVRFVMIALDKEKQKSIEFMKRKSLDLPVYFLDSALPGSYEVHSIPTTYVIGKDGTIHIKNHGMASYNTENFRSFLSELSKAQ